MAVYQPTYRDKKTGKSVKSEVWWYNFIFAGRHIQESSKSTKKTVAREAEKKRRQELENGFNNLGDVRRERVRSVEDLADEYFADYRLRNPKSATYAEYAIGHIKRLSGKAMSIDVSEKTMREFQMARLKEKAAPKSINEEIGFFLRILGESGEIIRAKMRRQRTLKLKIGRQVSKAFTVDDKSAMLAAAKALRSPSIFPALTLALNVGLRDAEIRCLQWGRLDLAKGIVTVSDSKTEAGEGRTIPMNSETLSAILDHARWYLGKFGETREEWYVFPFGKPQPNDPTKPVVTFKTAWQKVKAAAGVKGRWHDNRHTFITDLAESGEASDETIRDMAGHVSKQMLKHYSHIRMEAKRRAVESLVRKPQQPRLEKAQISDGVTKESTKVDLLN